MRRARASRRRLSRWGVGAVALLAAALAAVLLVGWPSADGIQRAAGAAGAEGEPYAQTDDAVPAHNMIVFGATPEDPSVGAGEDETWGVGEVGRLNSEVWRVLRYTRANGWSPALPAQGASGGALAEFRPDSASPLTGTTDASGDGVLVGTAAPEKEGLTHPQVVLVRDPHADEGAFRQTAPIPPALLKLEGQPAQELFVSGGRAPLLAALDENGHAGALVVPVSSQVSATETGVLHWSGATREWTREPIEMPGGVQEGFHVLAIGASSLANAWLLAQLSSSSSGVALFRRQEGQAGEPTTWQPVAPAPGAKPAAALTIPRSGGEGKQLAIPGAPSHVRAQVLAVTSEGLWIDAETAEGSISTTVFFKPKGAGLSGEVAASWCRGECTYSLPLLAGDGLPVGPSRSFAWSGSGPFGQRVITGFAEGVTLRLEGSEFRRVVSLGGSEAPNDVGGTLGAAFSNPREGWLGNELLPVHVTEEPAPDRLQPYPVPFHDALAAIASQPEAPVGALTSQAVAVGDQGEVARYVPGEGWQPESLLSPSGRPEHPRLRAVSWPTPNRIYAAGEAGEAAPMWLWRAETGLWEPDPATPVNFRGTILGIAFEPGNPSRGYAVGEPGVAGEPGVLLRYGKTWTQETLPPEVDGAVFTSVAFAGSEAIVAFRIAHHRSGEVNAANGFYTGGLLVNEGSGWHVDQGATEAIGPEGVPWAVAGLPDGGAALSAETITGEPLVVERNSQGSSWQPTAIPYPAAEPSSLALFREGDTLRAIGAGSVPDTRNIDFQVAPPAGNPEDLLQSYPLAAGEGSDPLIRQTASGWSDEEHTFDSAQDPLGEYKFYDMVDQPEPIAAVLTGPGGEQGWAVGGVVDNATSTGAHDSAEVARYPAEPGVTPPGVASSTVQVNSNEATFAIGGNAACEAPCADRENAGIGPDVWLSSALQRAGSIGGVRAFVYTGPRLTTGLGHGTSPVPYPREFARYATLMGQSKIPAFVAASATDREGPPGEGDARSACEFAKDLGEGFRSAAIGKETRGEFSLAPAGSAPKPETEFCSAGQEPGYYSLRSEKVRSEKAGEGKGPVRVIVLEDATEVGPAQLEWLKGELASAAQAQGPVHGVEIPDEPAIVIGNANLGAQAAAGDANAGQVVKAIVEGGASAYFYDAPEENVSGTVTAELKPGESKSIPTFGSGTLGYVVKSPEEASFKAHSGFLLAQVPEPTPGKGNFVTVTARLIPDIGELSLEAKGGVLLRRSSASLFAGLARRPRGGGVSSREQGRSRSFDYIPIGKACVEASCNGIIPPEFRFRSSEPNVGKFVKPNTAAASEESANAVLLENEKPIPDEESGLFCALNAGETTVTLEAGGLSASLKVTVEEGSVRRPCGTTPINKPATSQQTPVLAPPPPPPPPPNQSPPPAATLPPPPPPPLLPAAPSPARPVPRPVPPPLFIAGTPPVAALPAFVPLPVPSPARPTPPSGTSAVTSPVEVAEHQEEEEEATESVSNQAVAYRAPEHEPAPAYLLGIIVLAAFAGATARRGRPRRGRGEVRVAPATLNTMRSQRRNARRRGPW